MISIWVVSTVVSVISVTRFSQVSDLLNLAEITPDHDIQLSVSPQ